MKKNYTIPEYQKEIEYLSSQLEETFKELARLDLHYLNLTRQKKQAIATCTFIKIMQEKIEEAFTIDDLYVSIVKALTSELSMDSSALIKINYQTRKINILASEGLSENVKVHKLDKNISKKELLTSTFVNSKSSFKPFHLWVRKAFEFPYFVWYPIADEEDGTLVLFVGNAFEDLVLKQPFSEASLETLGALSSVILLRRKNIAKTQEMLRKKEKRIDFLAEILKTSTISVIATNKDVKITYVNPATEKLYGYKAEELIGKDPGLLTAEPDAPDIQKAIVDTIRQGKIWRGEILNKKKNGDLIYIHAIIYQLLDKEENFMAMVGFQEDITERKRAEEALKESEEKYRKIVENVYDIVYSSYVDGTIHFISPNVLSIIGYKPEEIIGHNPIELVHPDDREQVLSDYEKTIKTGEEFPTIFRLLKKDGSYFYVEEFGKVVREGDEIVGITGVLRDITERKRAEKALGESEDKFRSLFESAPEFIHILDRNCMILQTNPTAILRSGYTEKVMVGRSLAEFLTSASQKIFAREFSILMKKGNHRVEIEFVCKDGTIIISDCSCMVVRNERGEIAYIVTFLRDITERKKAEEKLKIAQKELEIKAKNLEETNTALKVLLKYQDTEKNIMEKNILTSLKTLVLPYLEKIKISTSDERQKTYVNIVETNLSEITKPFINQLTEYYSKLTPTEIQITSLIRENKTAKDIASILDVSETTVFFHRRNIRKKLGLKNKKANLRSYLQSVASD